MSRCSVFQFMKYFYRCTISLKLTATWERRQSQDKSPQFIPRQGFFRKENLDGGGEQGLVLWLLRLAAQHRLERQGWVGLGRVG